jgi:hypothetical protein
VAYLDVPTRERRREDRGKPRDTVAERAAVRHGKDHADDARPPASLGRQEGWHQPRLAIEHGQHVLKVVEFGLHLDQKQGSLLRPPSNYVYRAAFAEVAEAVLDRDFPATGRKPSNNSLDERGMARVDEARELPAAPSGFEWHADLEGRGDPANRPHRQAIQLPSLHD